MTFENTQVVLAERPTEGIVPGQTFRIEKGPRPSPDNVKDGEILVEVLLISVEPAMRGWITDTRSYLPPVQIGETMRSFSAARVLASKSKQAQVGDIVVAASGWAEYAIVPESRFEPAAAFPKGKEPHEWLSMYGLTGMTAWVGMTQIGEPKPRETVVVSAAAGATGSIAGQIAKNLGAKVIGICGGDSKCKWIREVLGFDVALDYKAADFKDRFMEATKDYIDVYFDSVGGEILDMCLGQANKDARFIQCGIISRWSSKDSGLTLKNYFKVIAMRIKIQGFVVTDYVDLWPRARKEIAQWSETGRLKGGVVIVDGGLAKVEEALISLYAGGNTGKLLVKVKDIADAPVGL
ncbi:hypothetical protein QQS21_007013 [Conoideocrella luteorostrata]|uniref:Dehydrogenase FUB6 n=1 Tax=Conoideocrella luteorostrata TaxID=1105319 RepID=A0AAJ0CLL4_9HYPO|nr:hypothetical protein QQS21_007013 [Conoideocrella luteorostrata]